VAAYHTRRTAGDTGCLLISGSPITLQLIVDYISVSLCVKTTKFGAFVMGESIIADTDRISGLID
jgi:hypothetical protein